MEAVVRGAGRDRKDAVERWPVGFAPLIGSYAALCRAIRITVVPQRRPAGRGDMWRLSLQTNVIKDLPDVCAVRDERDDAHLATTDWAQQRNHLVGACDQNGPRVVGGTLGRHQCPLASMQI